MPSTSRRQLALPRPAAPLFGLAPPLLAGLGLAVLAAAACLPGPATSDSASETGSSSGSSGDDTSAPTTADEPEPPALGEARYFLRVDDEPVPPVRLEMDKAKSLEVFGEAAARNIKLLDVDSSPLLVDILGRIQSSCGDGWDNYDYEPANPKDPNKPSKKNPNFPNDPNSIPNVDLPIDPAHDCSLTELGLTYGPDWKHSPQFAMVRLLTMTPRNAVLKGTALEDFETLIAQFVDKNPNGFTLPDILAASLFCGFAANPKVCTDNLNDAKVFESQANRAHEQKLHTRPFIATDVLAQTLKRTLMASHPNIANDQGLLPVTLYDALKDMQPLSEKFGPVDGHPGLLMPDDANFTTRSDALTPDFKMVATAESNLRLVEGIDASRGAGAMFISTAAAPLSFDFLDESRVQLLGIAEAPTVDMRMRIAELGPSARPPQSGFVPACDAGLDPCLNNIPGAPVGDEHIWSQPVWSLEYIIADAAYASFNALKYPLYCFVPGNPCSASASIGKEPGAPGWTEFLIGLNGLEAPPAQYLWELLLSVAQVAVHNPAADNKPIAEGDANPIFALKQLPIGLTAAQMIAEIRPNLQAQAGYIANVILGKFWKNNDHLDFYYRRGADGGPPLLFFVAPGDPRPDPAKPDELAPYNYARPGFFADPALTNRLSRTTLDGVADTEHEKLQLSPGETTVYMQDDAATTYRLRFFVPPGAADPTEIVVHVRPV